MSGSRSFTAGCSLRPEKTVCRHNLPERGLDSEFRSHKLSSFLLKTLLRKVIHNIKSRTVDVKIQKVSQVKDLILNSPVRLLFSLLTRFYLHLVHVKRKVHKRTRMSPFCRGECLRLKYHLNTSFITDLVNVLFLRS